MLRGEAIEVESRNVHTQPSERRRHSTIATLKIESFADITGPILAFTEDVHRAEVTMEAARDAYSRRQYVRSLFAMIEGSIYVLKRVLLLVGSWLATKFRDRFL
jgi:hypothetical protein